MLLSRIGTRTVITVDPSTSVAHVACLMNDRSLGSIVVATDGKPVGIITDRDLVLRVICAGKDAGQLTAEEVMSSPLTLVSAEADALKAASTMREAQVRRLPIVDAAGKLVGIITLDDLIFHMSRTHHEMAETIASFPIPHAGG
ncbi:MAG: CBS domain-containing protein [Planctomycetota bacterium]|jgi:CBS domain-containing protein